MFKIMPAQPPPIHIPSKYLTQKKNIIPAIFISKASLIGNTIPDITQRKLNGIGSWHFAIYNAAMQTRISLSVSRFATALSILSSIETIASNLVSSFV